jgi:2-keto-3-deoxy-L-rhamnonate aldolase RhmA
MALAGFDFLVIDTEHGAINVESVQTLIQAISATPVCPLVRLAENRSVLAGAVLDAGAAGVIVPRVNCREEAEAAAQMALFPPAGTRGIGLARAYGFDPALRDEYVRTANALMFVGIQIEHRQAVDRMEEITNTSGIDLVLIGPADLSGSMGHGTRPEHPDVTSAIERVVRVATAAGIPAGIPVGGSAEIATRAKQGFRFFHLGADVAYLGQACKARLHEARQIAGEAIAAASDS